MAVRKEVLGIAAPERALNSQYYDKKCPFTGELTVKKEMFTGKVIKKDTNKSATIEMFRSCYVPKYERYEPRRSRLRVHNPPAIDAQVGDLVLVARTRPLSKTKNHVIIQIVERKAGEVKGIDSVDKEAIEKKKKNQKIKK